MSQRVSDLVRELPKSRLPAGNATDDGQFLFYVSGPAPLRCDTAIHEGNALILSTGGNAAVHYGQGCYSYSTDCWALEPINQKVEAKFLYYFISSQIDRIGILGFEGSGLRHLRKNFVRQYSVPDIARPEQTKIAEVLSTVDRAIEQTEAIIAKQERIKTGLMQDLLTRGIDEHGNLRSEKTHKFKDSPLGRIPVEWEVRALSDLVDEDITYGIVQAGPHIEEGVPYIRTGDMTGNNIESSKLLKTSVKIARSYGRSSVYLGDIVFALRATVGMVLPIMEELNGANLTQGTAKISPKNSISSTFLLWALRTSIVKNQIRVHQKGTTFMEITLTDLRKIKVSIPKQKKEQIQIANRLSAQYDLNTKYILILGKLRSLKTALMQDLLTGKKSVTSLLNDAEGIIV